MRSVEKALLSYNLLMVALGGAILLAIALATLPFRNYRASIPRRLPRRPGEPHRANLLIAMLDAETGQRGYLLTHDARYLEPFAPRASAA